MKIFRSVLSLRDKILRMFSPPMPESELTLAMPTGPTAIVDYGKWVFPQLKPSHLPGLAIEEVIMGKANNIVGHEFLVFKLRGGSDQYVTIERTTRVEDVEAIIESDDPLCTLVGQEPSAVPADERPALTQEVTSELKQTAADMKSRQDIRSLIASPTRASLSSPSQSSLSSSSKKSKPAAADTISPGFAPWMDDKIENDKKASKKDIKDQVCKNGAFKLYTYRISPPSNTEPVFSLREVVVIANVIHNKHQLYDWRDRNCYWFAATMMAVMERITKTTKSRHLGANWAGRAGPSKHLSIFPARESRASDIDELVDLVIKAIKEEDDKMKERCEEKTLATWAKQARKELDEVGTQLLQERQEKEEAEARFRQREEEAEARFRQEKEALLRKITLLEQSGSAVASSSMTRPVPA